MAGGRPPGGGFTKVYPTPDAEEFTLAPAREESGAVIRKVNERTRAKNAVHTLAHARLLPNGTRLRLVPSHGTTDMIRETIRVWVDADPRRATATWRNSTSKPLMWHADGQDFSPTGLANQIFTAVTDRQPDGIQGTMWWVVDGDHVPDGVDPAEWAQLADLNLGQLVPTAAGTGRDWTDLHAVLSSIPAGRWTTYGDLAAAIGSHAVPIGSHLSSCTDCAAPWRVLTAKGTVSSGFRWSDSTRTDTAWDALRESGVRFTNNTADPAQRLTPTELHALLNNRV